MGEGEERGQGDDEELEETHLVAVSGIAREVMQIIGWACSPSYTYGIANTSTEFNTDIAVQHSESSRPVRD